MCLIYFREINDGLTVDADGACEKDTLPLPKFKPQRVPGPQWMVASLLPPLTSLDCFLVMNY